MKRLLKKMIVLFLIASCIFSIIKVTMAAEITTNITADNFYVLYTGNAMRSNLLKITQEVPPVYWVTVETWTFSVNPGDYIYVLAWDGINVNGSLSNGGPQMWIAEFHITDGATFYSNKTDWLCYISHNPNPGLVAFDPIYFMGLPPDDNIVKSDIVYAQAHGLWDFPQAEGYHWIMPSSKAVWADGFDDSVPSDDHYVIFRTLNPVIPIPLPTTVWLFATGITGLIAFRKLKT